MNPTHAFEVAVLAHVTVIATATLLLMLIARRRSAFQHLVGVIGLMLILSSPILALALPQPAWMGEYDFSYGEPGPVIPVQSIQNEQSLVQAGPATSKIQNAVENASQTTAPVNRPDAAENQPSATSGAILSAVGMLPYMVWLIGAVVVASRIWRSRRMLKCLSRADSFVMSPSLREMERDILLALGLQQLPRIRVSEMAPIPLVLGVWKPVIVLPREIAESASDERLRDILIHECAHIVRRDPWIHLLQQMAACLFWMHPGLHWLNRQISRVREELCDNCVLQQGDSIAYAQTLLDVAQLCGRPRYALSTLGLFTPQWTLERRIQDLLDLRRPTTTRTRWGAKVAVLGMFGMVGLAAGMTVGGAAAVTDKQFEPVLLRTFRNSGRVNSLAFDSKGETLVTVGWIEPESGAMQQWIAGRCMGDIRVWNVANGTELADFGRNTGGVTDVAISPDDKTIVTAVRVLNSPNQAEVIIWDAKTFQPIRTLAPHQQWIVVVACSPDGKLIATGAMDNSVKIWEAATGKQVSNLAASQWPPYSLCFSKDSKTLVAGYQAGSVVLWDVDSGTQRNVFNAKGLVRFSADLSPDGKRLVAGGPDAEMAHPERGQGGRIHVWDVASGREELAFMTEEMVSDVAFSPSGKHFAAVVMGAPARFWAADTGQELTDAGKPIPASKRRMSSASDKLRFSSDGKRLAIAGHDHVALWNVSRLDRVNKQK
jgi:beta-lactamase regulating signal transducer with metallopeptidase domain